MWGGLAEVQRTHTGYGNEGRTKQLAASLSDYLSLFSYYPPPPTPNLLVTPSTQGGLQRGRSAFFLLWGALPHKCWGFIVSSLLIIHTFCVFFFTCVQNLRQVRLLQRMRFEYLASVLVLSISQCNFCPTAEYLLLSWIVYGWSDTSVLEIVQSFKVRFSWTSFE